ncbi:MAG: glycosyltransferase, partial [Lachnospiraceae bacterium]|nr:glycosyltransferase [Lachnospiraceae bacterium]
VRFLRGIVQNIGFKKATLEYEAKKRIYGKSRYNIASLIKLAKNTLYSYTDLPLVIGKFMGIISIICGLIVLIYTLITRKGAPSGYATVVILICFMFAILFFIIGVMGEYISIILKEVKDRPSYIIEDII